MERRQFFASAAIAGAAMGGSASALAQNAPAADHEVVLGQTGILSGPLGAPIRVVLAGAQLAFDAVNAEGGIAGRRVRLVSLDDDLNPEQAVNNYSTLLNQHRAFAFFCCVGSGTTAAAAPLLAQSGAPMVGGYAVSDSARLKAAGAAYFVRATFAREAQALVQHLSTIGVTRIAVAALDNPGGVEVIQLAQAAMQDHQIKPVASVLVKGDASDAAAAGKTLAQSNAQAVIMYLGGTVGGELMKGAAAAGAQSALFYGMSIVPGDLTARLVGKQTSGLAVSQVVPYPWSESDPLTREYRSLAERSQVPVGYLSFEGYVNALVMIEALRRTGRELTRARLHTVLKSLRMRVAGMEVDFSGQSNTGSRFIELVRVTPEGRFLR